VLISVTRLRLRHWRFLPAFSLYTFRSARQTLKTDGFMAGQLANGPKLSYWTVTLWRDAEAMRQFRNSGAHLAAMPKLVDWCDEGAVAHTETDVRKLPTLEEAYRLLKEKGRVSPVRHPSPAHTRGETAGDTVPRGTVGWHSRTV
jgi:hypothetical protein